MRPILAAVFLLLPLAAVAAERTGSDGWYRVEWQGVPAGWMHEVASGRTLRTESLLRVSRLGATVTVWDHSVFSPASPGHPASLLYELSTGPADTLRLLCRFDRDSARVDKSLQGEKSHYSRALPDRFLLPDQVDSLWKDPGSADGREVLFASFSPEVDGVLAFRARMEGLDTLRLPAGERILRRWRTRCDAAPAMETVEWRDARGELWKSETPAADLSAVRVSREEALASAGGAEVITESMIALQKPLDSIRPYRRVLYRVTSLRGSGPLRPPADPLAVVRASADSMTIIECRRIAPPGPLSQPAEPSQRPGPSAPDTVPGRLSPAERARALSPTLLIESDDPAIRNAAQGAVGTERDPWKRAVLLQKFVTRRIREKDLRILFGSARRTLASGEGDCTEHAILLAALARAEGIPSRVVAGLVAAGDRMAYHLWTEMDLGAGWIGCDAALGRSPVDGRYLPLAVSDLCDDSLGPLSFGVAAALGKIRIEVLESEVEP